MITVELLDRLVEATNEAKATVRECHEARRDLKLAMKEADERIGKVRAEVAVAVDELAVELTRKTFDKVDYERVGAGLKKALADWIEQLDLAKDVLERLDQKAVEAVIFLPTEPNTVLSIARAAAAPSPAVGPPSAAGGGTGASREPVGSGKSPVAPVRSTSEYGPRRVLRLLLGGTA